MGSTGELARFIRHEKRAVFDEWSIAVRMIPQARTLSGPALRDHVPDLLDRVSDLVERGDEQAHDDLEADADQHAFQRLEAGFDLRQVVTEYAYLRECILRRLDQLELGTTLVQLRVLNRCIDTAIAASVDNFVESRNRTLRTMDQIATAALESSSLNQFLERLLQVFKNTTPAVDEATILLRQDDCLWVRAAVGFGRSGLEPPM